MKIAAITTTFNEPFFLPMWVRHYGEAFGYENLYVMDDGSTDGSTAGLGAVNVMRRARMPYDDDERVDLISLLQIALLDHYDVVIYSDIDEFIVLDPAAGSSLRQYLEAQPAFDVKTLIGFNVLHRVSQEGPIDFSVPVFRQRHYIQYSIGYTKPLVTRTPVRWAPGFHGVRARPVFDFNLYLFHLRMLDMEVALERLRFRNGLQFSARAISKNHSMHFRVPEREHLKMIGHPVEDAEFAAAEKDIDFVRPRLEAFLDGTDRVSVTKETIAEVPARFADALVVGPPKETPAASAPPPVNAQVLLERAMRLVRR